MSAQAQAKLVEVARSDAHFYTTAEINATKGCPPVSEPIPQNITQVGDDESRRKLALWMVVTGTGVAEELGWPKDAQYQVKFPEDFALRWQNPSSPNKAVVMYGHPMGCTEDYVYRQPYEFIPHLLWLLSTSTDQIHCPCKLCLRATGRPIPRSFKAKMDEVAAALDSTKVTKKTTTKAATKKKALTVTAAAAAATASGSDTGSKSSSKDAAVSAKPTKKSTTAPAKETPPAAETTVQKLPTPAALHPTANEEPTLFRRGEMIWFLHDTAWRLGIIREANSTAPVTVYTIVPLCHAVLGYPDVQKQKPQMRPFLTFSVPSVTLTNVPELQNTAFSQVNWPELLKNPSIPKQHLGLDASKLAALEIDGSWSTFNRLPAGPKEPKNVATFGGVFLGAEMIRLGDPLRWREKSRGQALLEVTGITVTTTQVANPAAAAPGAAPITQRALAFRGIEYEPALVPETARITAQPTGAIFTKDTEFRTMAARITGAKQKCVWTIKSWDTVWHEREVAGRSYVTGELMEVVLGAKFIEEFRATGRFQEASTYLNSRGQNTGARVFGWRQNRRTTVGHSVSQEQPLVFGDGVVEE